MSEKRDGLQMTPELRKMAEGAGLAFALNEGHSVVVSSGPTWAQLEAFARLVAEDCAKMCELHQNTEGDCIAGQIREKYLPPSSPLARLLTL